MIEPATAPDSEVLVSTERAGRYGKQLASHLVRKATSDWDDAAGRGSVVFSEERGRAELIAERLGLRMKVYATSEFVEALEEVLGRHLVHFGSRDELVVSWTRADGSAGSEQRRTQDG